MPIPRPASPRLRWLLLALIALAWFATLDYRALIKPDEGRYAEIAREMAVSGDVITPRLNGIKYFEKPPLQYWATAAAFRTLGDNEWTARLWPALTGFAGLFLAWLTGRRLFGRPAGSIAVAVLASAALYNGIGHMNTLDMGFTFFLQLALSGLLLGAVFPRQPRRGWLWGMWAGLALAVLSKGIAALVLCGGTLVVYSVLTRDFGLWRKLGWWPGLLIFAAICAPWFVLVSLANPEFPHFFFIHEHFERFLTTTHRREQPAWYFVPVLFLGLLPWLTLAPHGWLKAAEAARTQGEGELRSVRLLAIWCVLVFAFFSASGSKLPSYILPMFPALALLAGLTLPLLSRAALGGHYALLTVVAGLAIAAPELAASRNATPDDMARYLEFAQVVRWGGLACLVPLLLAIVQLYRRRALASLQSVAVAGFVLLTSVMLGHNALEASQSSRLFAAEIAPRLPADAPLYAIRTYDQTLPFYLKRLFTLVDFSDEMAFGLRQQPDLWRPSLADFRREWEGLQRGYAILDPEDHAELTRQGWPWHVIARDSRRVLVSRQPPDGSRP